MALVCEIHRVWKKRIKQASSAVPLVAAIVSALLLPYYTVLTHSKKAGRCMSAAGQPEVLWWRAQSITIRSADSLLIRAGKGAWLHSLLAFLHCASACATTSGCWRR